MRLRDAMVVLLLPTVLATGCSKLSFVKSDAQRRDMERVAPEYSFRDSPQGKQKASARRHLASAEQHMQAGDFDAAAAAARDALKADPGSSDAHTALGLLAQRSGDGDAAGRHYARAAELAPTDAITLGNYGAWLCSNGRAAESLAWFDKALVAPGETHRSATLANAGACAMESGHADMAERASRAALDIEPENAVALGTLAKQSFASARYMEARAFSERRLSAAPPTADALRLASQIEEKLGDTVAATRYVRRLRTEFPQARIAGPGESAQP